MKEQIKLPVVWGEMDAFGHVNNAVYFRYFESGRMIFFEDVELDKHLNKTEGPILAFINCQFKQPLYAPDTITVYCSVKEVRNTSFTIEHKVVSDKLGEVAVGDGVIVLVDYKTHEKVQIPAPLRTILEKYN